ncbi:hypothetical protein J2T37_001381 [Neisseria perflava]|nr:hypothetical protein [Neisseria perflava]MCP1772112.1 hypothetical protein [Neisseria perflava]
MGVPVLTGLMRFGYFNVFYGKFGRRSVEYTIVKINNIIERERP